MKNLHTLPTDKPSRLFEIIQFNLSFDRKNYFSEEYKKLHKYKNKNIYITSDEEIKEGDYYITPNNTVLKALGLMLINVEDYKKIILTTDQQLIDDGVQAIDDEFLKWFVKNSSCESVDLDTFSMGNKVLYNVVFPKKEPKQETLEEATENYCSNNHAINENRAAWQDIEFAFNDGAKWQQQNSHSDEEVFELLKKFAPHIRYNHNELPHTWQQVIEEWFKQFKKK